METTETKPLTKHIQTAVNAIQKQIDKYGDQIIKLKNKAYIAEQQADALSEAIAGLNEQISKLKGEV